MDRTKKKSLIVKFVCVLLSFVLWLYVSNVENPTRTSDVKGVAVELENQEVLSASNLYMSQDQNLTADLKLEGAANDIYSVNKNDFTLKADLSGYALKKGENNIPVEVISSPEGVTIKNKAVLTVKVNLEEGIEKNVKVSSKVKTSFKEGVNQKSISIKPSSVKVSGPESLVNSVVSVVLKGEISEISKDISQSFTLVPIDSEGNEVHGVELSEEKGKLNINVGAEKTVKVNPTYKGKLSDDLTLNSITLSSDTVSIVGDSSKLEFIGQINTEPIDLSAVTDSGSINIKLILPEGISLASGSDKITASIEVAKKEKTDDVITKKIDGVQVNITGKENNNLTYLVDNITVEVSGKSSEVNALTASNITASASAAGLTEAGEYEVSIDASLTNAGTSVSIVSKPEKIKITIK